MHGKNLQKLQIQDLLNKMYPKEQIMVLYYFPIDLNKDQKIQKNVETEKCVRPLKFQN